MLDRIADWLDKQPPGRRRLYSLFLAIVLLTVPCYAAGFALWALDVPGASMLPFGPRETAVATATATATAEDAEPDSPPPVRPTADEDEDEPEPSDPPPPVPTTPAPQPSATTIVFPTIVPRLATETPPPSATPLPPTNAPTATDPPPPAPSDTPAPPAEPSETPIGQITLEPTG
jgi:hypothetical protein